MACNFRKIGIDIPELKRNTVYFIYNSKDHSIHQVVDIKVSNHNVKTVPTTIEITYGNPILPDGVVSPDAKRSKFIERSYESNKQIYFFSTYDEARDYQKARLNTLINLAERTLRKYQKLYNKYGHC